MPAKLQIDKLHQILAAFIAFGISQCNQLVCRYNVTALFGEALQPSDLCVVRQSSFCATSTTAYKPDPEQTTQE